MLRFRKSSTPRVQRAARLYACGFCRETATHEAETDDNLQPEQKQCYRDVMSSQQPQQELWRPLRRRAPPPSAIPINRPRARSTSPTPRRSPTLGLRTRTSPATSRHSSTRRRPTSTACRSFGLHSISLPSESRTAVGHGRLPRMTSEFRRRSQVSTCALARAAYVNFIGISRRNGRS